jgi:hypothetical protein
VNASNNSSSTLSSSSSLSSQQRSGGWIEEVYHVEHDFLVFTLALPNHPFSIDMFQSLAIVAPMFPNLTITVGSGYEFNELCKQFSVHSYPKMLFFEKGVLKGRYNKNVYTPGVVAAQIARWMSVDAPKANPFGTFSTADYLSYSITGVLSHAMPNNFEQLMRIVEEFDLGQPLEPIAGSVEWLSRYDKTIFFLSGLYWIVRMCTFVLNKIKKQ